MGSHARPDWSPQEITLLKQLCDSGLYRFDHLAAKIGRSKSGVMYKCYEQKFQNKYRYHLYTHDKGFFGKITPETCYWAGVITTDGCLSGHRGGHVLTLAAAIKDMDHVERFKAAIQATNPIKFGKAKCKLSAKDPLKYHPYCSLAIDGASECLRRLGETFNITPNKTLRSTPPVLPSLYHRLCFVRGMIDGDGVVTAGGQEGFLDISICGCNRDMIAWVKEVVDSMDLPSLTRGTRSSLLQQPTGENCYYYHVRGLKAAILWEILQRLPLPRLSRKWDSPKALFHTTYWKARPEVWPPETFFTQYAAPKDSVSPSPTPTYTTPPIPNTVPSV